MFHKLEQINHRPEPFEFYTAEDLWTDAHTSQQMLEYHLNPDVDLSSRRTEFIERSVDWISSRFHVGPGVKIADFGCGPGLYAAKLARQGAQVTGIDFSKNSIEYARKVAADGQLNIQYLNQNYLEFETSERFDLILMIMCDFCALSPTQRRALLQLFHRLLKPKGQFLLDVYSLNAFDEREESATYELNQLDGFWSPEKYFGFLNTFKYDQEQVALDKYVIIEAHRTRTVYNWLQYFSPDTLQVEFESAGFIASSIYADVAGTPFDVNAGEFAVIGRKN